MFISLRPLKIPFLQFTKPDPHWLHGVGLQLWLGQIPDTPMTVSPKCQRVNSFFLYTQLLEHSEHTNHSLRMSLFIFISPTMIILLTESRLFRNQFFTPYWKVPIKTFGDNLCKILVYLSKIRPHFHCFYTHWQL